MSDRQTSVKNGQFGAGRMREWLDHVLDTAVELENVALFEQCGKLVRELDTLDNMLEQMRLDAITLERTR